MSDTKAPTIGEDYCCFLGDDLEAYQQAEPGPDRMALGCQDKAEYHIIPEGDSYDTDTAACKRHVGEMVAPIGTTVVTRLPI